MIKISSRAAVGVAALLALGSAPVLAWASAGGGGGGGSAGGSMPSISTPTYDPVEEYRRGIADLQNGKFRDAVRDFDHVLETNPDNAATLYLSGVAKTGAGDLKGALRAYTRSVKADSSLISAHRELAITLAKLGQPDKAQAELDTLKKRSDACAATCPEAADLSAAMAAVQAALAPATPAATPDAGATKAPASLLLHVEPGVGDSAYVEAIRLVNQKRYNDALVSLRKASEVFGPHPDILTYIGFTYRKLGDYDRAETYYRQALKIAPNHRGATEYYGELMVERGDIPGAKRMLARLDDICSYGCVEAEDLRRWIDHGPPAS